MCEARRVREKSWPSRSGEKGGSNNGLTMEGARAGHVTQNSSLALSEGDRFFLGKLTCSRTALNKKIKSKFPRQSAGKRVPPA